MAEARQVTPGPQTRREGLTGLHPPEGRAVEGQGARARLQAALLPGGGCCKGVVCVTGRPAGHLRARG